MQDIAVRRGQSKGNWLALMGLSSSSGLIGGIVLFVLRIITRLGLVYLPVSGPYSAQAPSRLRNSVFLRWSLYRNSENSTFVPSVSLAVSRPRGCGQGSTFHGLLLFGVCLGCRSKYGGCIIFDTIIGEINQVRSTFSEGV